MVAKQDFLDSIQIPFIRTKRPNRKSRLGCLSCKQRRVKCDEKRPTCTSCSIRASACVYPKLEASTASVASSQRANGDGDADVSSSSTESSSMDSQMPGNSEVSETELVQCFLSHVAHTFASSTGHSELHWIWHVFVPTVAYNSRPVRYGMLTAAAIYQHFSHIASGEAHSAKYIDTAISYGTAFVEQSRRQLQEQDPADTDANIACARFLGGLAFAFFRYDRRDGMKMDIPEAWTWLHLMRGVKLIHEQIALSGQHIDPLFLRDLMPELDLRNDEPISNASSPAALEFVSNEILSYVDRTRYERFAKLQATIQQERQNLEEEQYHACLATLKTLVKTTDYIYTANVQSLFRVLCTWIGSLPQQFVNMLTDGHHTALVIYSHWLMLVILAEEWWWIDDMGRAGIRDVLYHIGADTSNFEAALSCPREILELSTYTRY